MEIWDNADYDLSNMKTYSNCKNYMQSNLGKKGMHKQHIPFACDSFNCRNTDPGTSNNERKRLLYTLITKEEQVKNAIFLLLKQFNKSYPTFLFLIEK